MIGGVDEAGKGPVFGPLVVAGVVLSDESILKQYNIRDSKTLSPKQREYLVKKIKQIAERYEVLIISAEYIDTYRKTRTLNQLEVDVFGKVIDKLRPEICYVDAADVNEARFGREILKRLSYKPQIVSKHKADSKFPIVSAASILAKTVRDEQVKSIESKLRKDLNLPLGSGYPADPITKKFLERWVQKYSKLPPYIRHSWKTAENALKNVQTKRLDEF